MPPEAFWRAINIVKERSKKVSTYTSEFLDYAYGVGLFRDIFGQLRLPAPVPGDEPGLRPSFVGVVQAIEEALQEAVRSYFGDHSDYADHYMRYLKSHTPQRTFPDEMLQYILSRCSEAR